MSLLIKSLPLTPGYTPIASLKYLTFGRLHLTEGSRSYSAKSEESEVVLDFYSGRCRIRASHKSPWVTFDAIGRRDAFDGAPWMLYLPPESEYTVECPDGEAVIVLFTAAAQPTGERATMVPPEGAVVKQVGKDNWTRTVYTSVGEQVRAARLIVGETVNPPGNWSSSPPHKHDRYNPPNEAPMEEIYHFQVHPRQGFGFMRVYTGPDDAQPFDETFVVEDGDTVLIPRGYHPVVAAPGYTLHYTWALAGEERRYGAWSDDPRHAWIKG